jgi:hypothetical protein
LDGEQHTTEKCPMQGFSEREEHRDGESKGMERVQGWKEIVDLHGHIITNIIHDLLCLEILVFRNFSVVVGCDCFLEVAGTGCCNTFLSSRYAVGNVH